MTNMPKTEKIATYSGSEGKTRIRMDIEILSEAEKMQDVPNSPIVLSMAHGAEEGNFTHGEDGTNDISFHERISPRKNEGE